MDFRGIDFANIEPAKPFEALTPGWYKCVGISADPKPTRDQCGGYLEIAWEVIDGDRRGSRIFSRLNLTPSPNGKNPTMTRQIAERELAAISEGVGYVRPNGPRAPADLLNKPIMVKVGKSRENPDFNEVKGYGPVAKAAQAASSSATGSNPKPWEIKKKPAQELDD